MVNGGLFNNMVDPPRKEVPGSPSSQVLQVPLFQAARGGQPAGLSTPPVLYNRPDQNDADCPFLMPQ